MKKIIKLFTIILIANIAYGSSNQPKFDIKPGASFLEIMAVIKEAQKPKCFAADKTQALLKDDTSFQAMEERMRSKYPSLPSMRITDECGSSGILFKISNTSPEIIIHPIEVAKHTEAEMAWVMLHETGHSTKPWIYNSILNGTAVAGALTFALWGRHKSISYKNILTKVGSKSMAALSSSLAFYCLGMRAEEARANQWANDHADEQTLRGAVGFHERLKAELHSISALTKIPYSVGQYLFEPTHPTVDSIITKCKKALKSRFNTEA